MDASGVIAYYVMDGNRPLTATTGTDTTSYLYGLGAIGEETDAWSYGLLDGTNTQRQLTDALGEVTYSARYTPWGDTLESSGAGNFTFGYFGGLMDAATGLLYVGDGQYYDPSTGRFLTRSAKPNQTNPYLPFDPTGAMLGPLGVLALVLGSKKKKSKYDVLLFVLVFAVTAGIGVTACQQPSAGSTVTAVVTPVSSNTAIIEATVNGGTQTPAIVSSPTKTVEEILAELCANNFPPSNLPKLTIFFGGSYGQDRIGERMPFPEYQTNAWYAIADLSVPYPGNKTQHAKQVDISAYTNFNLVVIGYSSGADTALIFSYAYYKEQQKQGFSGRITGLAMLGGTITGELIGGGNIEAEWPRIFNELIVWGTDIYVLNDDTRTSGAVSGYSPPPCDNPNVGRFWYHDLPTQEHWSGPWSTEVSYYNVGTNNSAGYRDSVISWLNNN